MEAFIEDIKSCQGKEDVLCARWRENEYGSQSAVMLLRLLTSAYLQSHADDYMAFITEELIGSNQEQTPMQLFCQRNVECMGVESDQIHIVALCNALRCKVSIIYLDDSFSETTTPLVIGDALSYERDEILGNIPFPLASINMLYRPGHYDLIYPVI